MESIAKFIQNGSNAVMRRFTKLPSESAPKKEMNKLRPGEVGYAFEGGPAITKLTKCTEKDFAKQRQGPIMSKLLGAIPAGIRRMWSHPQPCAITDKEFAKIIDTTPYCMITKRRDSKTLIIDMQHMRNLKTFPGMQTAGIKVYLNADGFLPRKIVIFPSDCKEFAVCPCDKAWDVAKMLAMRALNHIMTLGAHPLLHFPMNVIGAFAQSDLSKDNPVYHFLQPHIRFTLGINDAVLNHDNSILVNHNNFASPFDCKMADVYQLHFIPEWKQYHFVNSSSGYPCEFQFGRMMQQYRDVLERWVKCYLKSVHLSRCHWKEIKEWFEHISCHLNGWWQDCNDKTLIAALTSIMIKVSVEHSAQHYLYSQVPSEVKPWRWRHRIPQHADDDVDVRNVQWRVDGFQEEIANRTFFSVNPASLLKDVKYKDECGHVIAMNYRQFKCDLEEVEECYPCMPLKFIAPSIDY